jgi:predicted nucleic acid-binding protein
MIVDTSAIIALADRTSTAHAEVSGIVRSSREPLVVPVTVLPEADYLLTTRLGPRVAIAFLESIVQGDMSLEHLTSADVRRALEIVKTYTESDVGFVDASIVALAERLRVGRILTLDRRHFHFLRPAHRAAFELLP